MSSLLSRARDRSRKRKELIKNALGVQVKFDRLAVLECYVDMFILQHYRTSERNLVMIRPKQRARLTTKVNSKVNTRKCAMSPTLPRMPKSREILLQMLQIS